MVECENYRVVKDVCAHMGLLEKEKDFAIEASVISRKSTDPFLEPEEGDEGYSCEHTTDGINYDTAFIASDKNTNCISGNECERTDQVSESRSKASSVERAFPGEDTKPSDPMLQVQFSTRRDKEIATENVQQERINSITDNEPRQTREGTNFDHDQSDPKSRNSTTTRDGISAENHVGKATCDHPQQDEEGETSFSGANASLVEYSGSLSHRSDASTTSGRSFAFPILQSEWNSSPVKMAKADRRQHKGWRRSGFLCCRF